MLIVFSELHRTLTYCENTSGAYSRACITFFVYRYISLKNNRRINSTQIVHPAVCNIFSILELVFTRSRDEASAQLTVFFVACNTYCLIFIINEYNFRRKVF